MMSALKRDFFTGLTALVGLVGLVVTLWLIGDLKDVVQETYTFTLKLNSASTLGETSRVALNGVKVGGVLKSRNQDNPAEGVVLTLKIKQGVRIPDNFTVYVDRGFVGESVLQLDIPEPTPEHPASTGFVEPGSVYSRRAKTLFDAISDPMREPLAKLNVVADSIEKLAATYDKVGNEALDLMKPRTPAEVQAGAAPNIRSSLASIEKTLTGAQAWLNDDALRADTKTAISKVSTTADAWTATAKSTDTQVTTLGPKISDAIDEAKATMRRVGSAADQVNEIAAAINKGDGTAGKFINNPDLYNNLNDAAARLEKALVELQLLIQKYKSEGIPIKL